jgi:multidrug transporter EmrE-like cation transporter
MNAIRMLGVALIIAGVLGLAYGGFSYTKETQAVKIGPIELNVKEKKDVNIPMWAGIAAIVAGGLMVAAGGKKG